MDQRRIAAIRPAKGTGGGSGYLVASREVLTAHHILNNDRRPAKVGETRMVSLLAWADPKDWREAKISAIAPALDLALLRFPPEVGDLELGDLALVRFGRLPKTAITCDAIGFPNALDHGAEKRWVDHHEEWRTDPLSGEWRKLLQLKLANSGCLPLQPGGWQGYSGAAVFTGELLCAVAVTVPTSFNGILWARPIVDVTADPDFTAALEEATGAAFAPEQVPVSVAVTPRSLAPLADLLCLIDREDQEGDLRDLLKQVVTGRKANPMVCLVAGESHHEHHLLIDRFERYDLPAICEALRVPRTRIENLPWPKRERNVETAHRRLLDELEKVMGCDVRDVRAVVAGINSGAVSRAFFSKITASTWTQNQRHAVDKWLDYWGRLGQESLHLPVTVFLAFDYDGPAQAEPAPTRSLLARMFGWRPQVAVVEYPDSMLDRGDRMISLERLSSYRLLEVDDINIWLERKVAVVNPELGRDLGVIGARLRAKLYKPLHFPLRALRERVDQLIAGEAL